MKTQQVIIILQLLVVLLFAKCKPCQGELNVTVPLTTEIKAYFEFFKPGNYWIYENQDGTKRDSVTVEKSRISQDLMAYNGCTAMENLHATFDNSFIFNGNYVLNTNNYELYITYNSSRNPFTENFDSLSELQIPNTYIRGIFYDSLLLLESSTDNISKLYFAKNIGIIRAVVGARHL
jgi:hypothetical protein